MTESVPHFSIEIGEVSGTCPVGEKWANENIRNNIISVLACEGPCIRGEIARLAANIVARKNKYGRACYAEVAIVPHSSMAKWVKGTDKVIMIDGCFLS